MWANQIMLQWDAYLDGSDTLQHSFFIYHPPKYFKRLDEDSYRHYRQAMQLLDCALLDVQTLQYPPRPRLFTTLPRPRYPFRNAGK